MCRGLRGERPCAAAAYAPSMSRIIGTIVLLTLSNVFMTAAWYGHLKWFGQGNRFALPFRTSMLPQAGFALEFAVNEGRRRVRRELR